MEALGPDSSTQTNSAIDISYQNTIEDAQIQGQREAEVSKYEYQNSRDQTRSD
jgi:hypothetical protein